MSALGDGLAHLFNAADLRSSMAALLSEHRTVTAASRAAGVDRRTWQRWASGAIQHAKPGTLAKVQRAAGTVPAAPTVNTSGNGRPRALSPQTLKLAPGTMQDAAAAYDTGGGEAAAAVFLGGVGDSWYRSWLQGELDNDSFGSPSAVTFS